MVLIVYGKHISMTYYENNQNNADSAITHGGESLNTNAVSHRNLIDNMRNGYSYCQVIFEDEHPVDFIHQEVNARYESMTGMKNIAGRRATEVFPGIEKSYPEFIEKQAWVAQTGIPDRFEMYVEPLSSWFDISVYSPKKGHFVSMIDNITERKKAEQTLLDSESRFRKLFQYHSASLMVIDPDDPGNSIHANHAAEFYGLTAFLRRIQEMAETSSVEELLRMTLDEAVRLTQSVIGFAFFVAKDQNSLSLQACSTNNEDCRCRTEGERRHHYPLDNSGVWADAVREKRTVIHNHSSSFNHHEKSREGYAEVQRELVVPVIRDDRIAAVMSIGNKPGDYDEKDLKRVEILANLAWDIVSKKITEEERKKLEYQIQHSRKMEMVGHLAAGIAHELNNPLNVIAINFANIQEANADLQAIVKEYQSVAGKLAAGTYSDLDLQRLRNKEAELALDSLIDDIPEILAASQRGFDRITSIIQSMRNLSHKLAIDNKMPFDINKGIADTLVDMRHEYSPWADIKILLQEELPLVHCNPEQINQVLLNLIINSIHAIQSQQRSSNGTITIQSWFDNCNVYCSIADDGPGLPDTIRSDIFNPFFTTRYPGKGRGLGLSISYDIIVIKHGGMIYVDSPAAGGTVFTLSLPIQIS